MNLKEIKELIEIFNKSEISRLKIKQDPFEIEFEKNLTSPIASNTAILPISPVNEAQAPVQQAPQTPKENASGDFILSPMVGTFYHCPSPGAAPYVKVGDTIKKAKLLALLRQ